LFVCFHYFIEQNDDDELVDNTGAGYSFFKKQQVDARPLAQPSLDISPQDLFAYMQASAFDQQPVQTQMLPTNNNAFGQQQLIPRSNIQAQNFLPRTIQVQQPVFVQRDFPQIPSTFSSGYSSQQSNLPIQSRLLATNTFGNQQMLPPQNNFNLQQKTFSGYDNQQQDLSFVQQPQQTWSTQQQSAGFSSSFGNQGQPPVSSGFFYSIQSTKWSTTSN